MRKVTSLTVAILLIALPAFAARPSQATAPAKKAAAKTPQQSAVIKPKAPALILPAEATLVTEINLSQKDLLGMFQQAIPAFAKGVGDAKGPIGDIVRKLDFNELAQALRGMRALRLVQFELKEAVDPNAVLPGLQQQLSASKGWERILFSTAKKDSTIEAYALDGKAFVVIGFDTKKNRNVILSTDGFIDIPKLASWAGKAVGSISQSYFPQPPASPKAPETQPQQPTPPNPAPGS